MEEVVKNTVIEARKELLKNTSISVSLEGWPCAIAVVGLSAAYVISIKIKYDRPRLSTRKKELLMLWHINSSLL